MLRMNERTKEWSKASLGEKSFLELYTLEGEEIFAQQLPCAKSDGGLDRAEEWASLPALLDEGKRRGVGVLWASWGPAVSHALTYVLGISLLRWLSVP